MTRRIHIPRGVMVGRYGAVKGDRWQITCAPNKRARTLHALTIDNFPHGPGDTIESPSYIWPGASGFYHWVHIHDVTHPDEAQS